MTNTPPQPPDAVLDPEPWDYLARHRDRKQRCLDDAARIQDACPKDPGHAKTPAADCKVCHRKIIDRISRRYLDRPEAEWYADRRPFLQHLAELFPAVKRGEVDASGIEDRVMDEKRRWHREAVRRLALAMGQLGMPQRRDELTRLLDDRKLEFGQFCARVRDVVSTTPCPPGALERLISTRNDPEARVEANKEVFFPPQGDEPVGDSARRYLDMVERGVSMSKVASRIVEDRRQGIADRAELERLQNRIEYLKKAKATWLAQRKRGQAEQHEEKPNKAPPPCLQCGLRPDVADPPSCAVCQVAVAHGIMDEPVVYCSEECQRLGHGQHVEKAHKCAAGEHCVTLYRPEEDKESGGYTDPTGYEWDAYLCKECLEQRKSVAVFCTLACAEASFTRHRERVHHRTSWSGGAKANLVTLEQALQDLKEKRVIDELKFVPKLRPVADAPKTQPAADSDARMAIEKEHNPPSTTEPHAATAATDEMDTDGADKREIDAAPAGPPHTSSIRHSDQVPGVDKMEGVETEPATQQPADDRNADTEMMDAVDVADFAMRREPPEAEPASAVGNPAAEDSTAQTPAAKTSTTGKSAAAENSTTEISAAKEPTTETQAAAEESAKEESVAKESVAEEPIPEELAAEGPPAKEPAASEEPTAENPAEKEEPATEIPAAKEPAAEPTPEAAANPRSESPKDAAASPTPDSNPHSGLHSDPTSDPYPFKNVPTNPEDAAGSLSLAEPKTAEEANRPSRTIAAPDNKVTSIEPMPSLGRSLEVEIGKIPAGQEAEPSDAGAGAEAEDAGAEEVLAQIRNIDVKAMDKIADEKAVGLNHGALLGARREEAKEPKDPREDGFTQAAEDVAAAGRAIDKEIDAENDRRAAKEEDQKEEGEHPDKSGDGEAGEQETGSDKPPAADHEDGSEKPDAGEKAEGQQQPTVGQQPKDDNAPAPPDEPASEPVKKDVAEAPAVNVSQPSAATSMEEGEIADDAGKKRKAPSAEPGEADGEHPGEREAKKARSEEAADTGAGAKTDIKAGSGEQTRRD